MTAFTKYDEKIRKRFSNQNTQLSSTTMYDSKRTSVMLRMVENPEFKLVSPQKKAKRLNLHIKRTNQLWPQKLQNIRTQLKTEIAFANHGMLPWGMQVQHVHLAYLILLTTI